VRESGAQRRRKARHSEYAVKKRGRRRSSPICRSYVFILPIDYDIIFVVISVADAELPQPHYDSTLPFKEGSALILLSVSDVLA